MKRAYSFEEIRKAEANAVENGASVWELMQAAGKFLAEDVERAMRREGADDCLFVCGGGNNGGDGFVAAEILRGLGYEIAVLCMSEELSPACRRAKEGYRGELFGAIPRRRYAFMVDCLFGTGLNRPVEGKEKLLVELLNGGSYVVSCDVPSGLSAGGLAFDPAVRADETVTMGLKQELLLADGADLAGEITIEDLEIPMPHGGALVYEDEDVAQFFPKRRSHTNKGDYGVASIMAGGTFGGAAFLATEACLKSGAGYTKLLVIGKVFPYAIGKIPAAVLREFTAIDGDMLASDCIAIGMGTGVSERLYVHIEELLTAYTGTLVLDADALNTLAIYGLDVLNKRSCRVIVTPHPKEFSRLTGRTVEEILRDPIAAARAFSEKYGVTVVLKNNRTVIAEGERVAINFTGSPALAKGGSGDVLAGFLAGTAARGLSPFEASVAACYILGRAGEIAAHELGEYAPDATDVIERLPRAILSVCN